MIRFQRGVTDFFNDYYRNEAIVAKVDSIFKSSTIGAGGNFIIDKIYIQKGGIITICDIDKNTASIYAPLLLGYLKYIGEPDRNKRLAIESILI